MALFGRVANRRALIRVAAVVGTQKLSPNERVGIATDDPVARDHVVRLHASARTKSIHGIRLSVVGDRAGLISVSGLMPVGAMRRLGRFHSDRRGDRHEHADEREPNMLLHCHSRGLATRDLTVCEALHPPLLLAPVPLPAAVPVRCPRTGERRQPHEQCYMLERLPCLLA